MSEGGMWHWGWEGREGFRRGWSGMEQMERMEGGGE